MTEAAWYVKIVEWSDADGAFVGQCPGIIGPCCHGPEEAAIYRELCEIVEEWIAVSKASGRPLPPPTAGRNVAALLA